MFNLRFPQFFSFELSHTGVLSNGSALRRYRHRRRSQWAGQRRVSRQSREEGRGSRTPSRARRRRRHGRDFPRLSFFRMFVRRLFASPRNHPRTRPPAPRPRNSPSRRNFFAHAQRRLPLARQRPRQIHSRHSPPLPPRRRGLRRILQDDDAHVPLREAHALHGSARPHHAQSQRPQAASFPVAALPRTLLRRALHASPTHDHELRRFPRPVVRNGRAQGDDVRLRHHRHVPRHSLARHRLRSPPSLHGRNRRRIPLLGLQPRRHWRYFERHRRRRSRSRRRDSHESASRKNSREAWPRRRRRPAIRRRTLCQRGLLQRGPASHLRKISRTQRASRRFPRRRPPLQIPRLFRQSQSRPRRASQFQMFPRPRRASSRRHLHFSQHGIHGARLRRRQVRPLLPQAVH